MWCPFLLHFNDEVRCSWRNCDRLLNCECFVKRTTGICLYAEHLVFNSLYYTLRFIYYKQVELNNEVNWKKKIGNQLLCIRFNFLYCRHFIASGYSFIQNPPTVSNNRTQLFTLPGPFTGCTSPRFGLHSSAWNTLPQHQFNLSCYRCYSATVSHRSIIT